MCRTDQAANEKGEGRGTQVWCLRIPLGRSVITGPSVTPGVCVGELVGDLATPTTGKVGAYVNDGRQHSASLSPDNREAHMLIDFVDDAGNIGLATLRVSGRVGASNTVRPVWVRDCHMNRAFGMDFQQSLWMR